MDYCSMCSAKISKLEILCYECFYILMSKWRQQQTTPQNIRFDN